MSIQPKPNGEYIMATISNEVKVQIAIGAIKGMSTKELAAKYNVSESTVKRAKVSHMAEATKALEKSAKAKTEKAVKRGFKGRNGRVTVMREVFAKHDAFGNASELFDLVNKASKAAGLKEMQKASFYAMLSVHRKENPAA